MQAVTGAIKTRLGCLILTLKNICKVLNGGMNTQEALECVKTTQMRHKEQAQNQLFEFDARIAAKLRELPGSPSFPSLKNAKGLDKEGVTTLKRYFSVRGFVSLVEELGKPYIFEIDPFTAEVTLSGTVMEQAFMEHYKS
ncbi:MAG: hypothetical protein SGARI_005537 [Bacillariaceae sp.]